MYRVVDAHAHLDQCSDIGSAMQKAKHACVCGIVAVGTSYKSNTIVMEIAEKYSNENLKIFPALGLHPWDMSSGELDMRSEFEFIESNIGSAVALGEVGLDYWFKGLHNDMKEAQKETFSRVLELAARFSKPVIIHSRGAWEDCFELTEKYSLKKAVFHWYSGPKEILEHIIEKGYFISATPALEYSKPHQDAIKHAPLESIVLETDTPVKYKGKESEPADVIKTLELVAELKNISKLEVAEKTTENAIRIFGILL